MWQKNVKFGSECRLPLYIKFVEVGHTTPKLHLPILQRTIALDREVEWEMKWAMTCAFEAQRRSHHAEIIEEMAQVRPQGKQTTCFRALHILRILHFILNKKWYAKCFESGSLSKVPHYFLFG